VTVRRLDETAEAVVPRVVVLIRCDQAPAASPGRSKKQGRDMNVVDSSVPQVHATAHVLGSPSALQITANCCWVIRCCLAGT
jgi:hypothetical protein